LIHARDPTRVPLQALSLLDAASLRIRQGLIRYFKLGKFTISDFEKRENANPKIDRLTMEKVYGTHAWAYAGIYCIASAAASLPIKVMRKMPGGQPPEEVEGHRLIELIEDPNPFMTRYDLIELLVIMLESTGDGYVLFDNGKPNPLALDAKLSLNDVIELWPMPSHMVKPKQDPESFIKSFNYRPEYAAKGIELSVAEVLKVSYANPLSLIFGQGSLIASSGAIRGDLYQEAFNNKFFKDGGIPAAFLKTDKTLTSEQREELKRGWAAAYSGVQNAHKIAILEAGLDFSLPRASNKDMEFVELTKLSKEKVLATLGVPGVFVGSEHAKYDNADQQKAIFWENTMLPKLRKIAGMLTKKLKELGEDDDLFVMFDTSGVKALQADHKVQADTALIWFGMGVPVNNLIKAFGPSSLEAIENGDVGLVSNLLVPLEEVVNPSEPLDPEGTQEDAPPGKPGNETEDQEEAGEGQAGGVSDNPQEEDAEKNPKGKKGLRGSGGSAKRLDDAHWKRYMARNEVGARRLRAAVKKFFVGERKRVLARIAAHYKSASSELMIEQKARDARVDLIVLSTQEESKELARVTEKIIKSIYKSHGDSTVEDLDVAIAFDIESPAARQFLEKHVFQFSFEVNKTTTERLRSLLQEKIAEGATQKELTDAVQDEFGFYERYRAARIARTESNTAGNAGIFDGFKQAGVTTKRWISSRDEKVRDTHAIADGQEVDTTDPFDVGGFLLEYPGDPHGPPEEIVNCRCTMRGIV